MNVGHVNLLQGDRWPRNGWLYQVLHSGKQMRPSSESAVHEDNAELIEKGCMD